LLHVCNLSTLEAEEGGSQVQGPPGVHRETLSQNEKQILPPPISVCVCVSLHMCIVSFPLKKPLGLNHGGSTLIILSSPNTSQRPYL
jgi:hypothetical protein